MEAVFTLPYPEYEVLNQLNKIFTKKDYTFLVPTSRQQVGIDMAILNLKNNIQRTVQVKSSRSYLQEKGEYKYTLWFSNFIEKYAKGVADLYILLGIYPFYSQDKNNKINVWKTMILVFADDEMGKPLASVKTKKVKKTDKYFGFGFNDENKVFVTRGITIEIDEKKHILKNRAKELVSMFNN